MDDKTALVLIQTLFVSVGSTAWALKQGTEWHRARRNGNGKGPGIVCPDPDTRENADRRSAMYVKQIIDVIDANALAAHESHIWLEGAVTKMTDALANTATRIEVVLDRTQRHGP